MKLKGYAILILIALIAALVILPGCAKKECEVKSDCGSDTKCITYSCSIENKCIKTPKPNCCGNAKCEAASGENSCTCPDCGSCEKLGIVKYNVTSTRGVKVMDSKFARHVCENNLCVIGISPDDVTPLKLTGLFEERGFFQLDVLNTLNQPFNIKNDILEVRITLSDLNPKAVSGGIVITSIQILNGNYLMGEKILNKELLDIGSAMSEQIPLTSSQKLPEEEVTVTLKLDYTYIPMDTKGVILQAKRNSMKQAISTSKIMFVQP